MPVDKAPAAGADCAFILVNYNTGEYLFDLLDFFAREKPALPFTCQIIVVDNNSTDGSAERLAERGDVHLIRNSENLGYAKAVNAGIEAAGKNCCRYICVLNTDLKLDGRTLPLLWDFMEANPGAMMCCPMIYSSNGKVQGFFFKLSPFFIHMEFLKAAHSSFMKAVIGRLKKPMAVDGVAGTFLFFRSGLVKPGEKLFDEGYFFYFEDADLAVSLKKAGIRTFIVPGTHVVHFGSPTDVEFNWRLFYRNKYLFLEKNYGRIHARLARAMDRLKVKSKLLKYSLLKRVYPSRRVLSKYGHYSGMAERFRELG